MLAVLAVVFVVAGPFPKGAVLVSLTESHGVDAGDLPSWACCWWPAGSPSEMPALGPVHP